jgi:hypothetical protein
LRSLLAAMSIVLSSDAQNGGKYLGSIKDGGIKKLLMPLFTVSLLKKHRQ